MLTLQKQEKNVTVFISIFRKLWVVVLARSFHILSKKKLLNIYLEREDIRMWYMIYSNKSVDEMINIFEQVVPLDYYDKVFIFTYDRMKRYQGAWHVEQDVCFPKAIIVETENEVNVFQKMAHAYMECSAAVIPPAVKDILEKISDDNQHIRMSGGVIADGKMQITDGPLVGMEKYVKKIDRHKRLAWLEFEIDDGMHLKMQVGLEITSKS